MKIGNNCVVIGANSHTNGCDWCVIIGDNLSVKRDCRLRIKTGMVDINHLMSKMEAMSMVNAFKKTLLLSDIPDGNPGRVPELILGGG